MNAIATEEEISALEKNSFWENSFAIEIYTQINKA